MADRTGQRLGNYQLTRLLGAGGFAEVYLGEHLDLGRQAAIKVLTTTISAEEVQQFRAEARTIAQLKHPHIVDVLDYGVEGGVPFFVMQYAPGGTLRQRFPRGTQQPPTRLLPYVQQIASALQYAHDQRLIHRDIKPENMLLNERDAVVLSDFGIAVMALSSRLQNPQEVAGTAAYMAPEQIQGQAQFASDQYALGVALYEWLTGERPFQGAITELYAQHLHALPAPLREKAPQLSPAVETVVLTALNKNPKERFRSMQAFAAAFEHACCDEAASSTTLASTMPVAPGGQPTAPIFFAPTQSTPAASVQPPGAFPASNPALLALPAEPAALPATMTPSMFSPEQPPVPPGPDEPKPGLTRRSLLTGAAALGGVALVGGVAAWVGLAERSPTNNPGAQRTASASPSPTQALTPSPTAMPTPVVVTTPVYIYRGQTSASYAVLVAWSPDQAIQRIASGAQDGLQVWDAFTGKNVAVLWTEDIVGLAWSPNGQQIAFSSRVDGNVRVAQVASGAVIASYQPPGAVSAWSPDGQWLAGGSPDPFAWIWQWQTPGATPILLRGHTDQVRDVSWSPDGRYLASMSDDQTVRLWEPTTGTLVKTLDAQAGIAWSASWSPDSARLATGHDAGYWRVWDVATGQQLYQAPRRSAGPVTGLVWSPDGQHIASAENGSEMHVWNAATGNLLAICAAGPGHIGNVAWSPDSQYIASGSDDTTVQVWKVE